MAELIPRLECSFEEFQWRDIDTRFGARRLCETTCACPLRLF